MIDAVLLPYQQRWIEDPAPVAVCEKSRRVGLSWCDAADSVLTAAKAGGMDAWYIGYNQDMAREYIEDCGAWAKSFHEAASAIEEAVYRDEDKDILTYRIRMASGHKITALSSRPSNLRGKQGKITIDEAAFHDDLPGLIKAAIAMLKWGGRVRIISTHFGDANPFNELVQDIRAGKTPYSLHRITLDDALSDGLYRRICLRLGKPWSADGESAWRKDLRDYYGDNAAEELDCIPSMGSGAWLTRAVIDKVMDRSIPVLRWRCETGFAESPSPMRVSAADVWFRDTVEPQLGRLDPNRPCFFGEDFGRTGDLTVIAPLQETAYGQFAAPCLVELRNVPFEQQRQILFLLVDRLPNFRGGALDARGNGQYLAEVAMQRYGAGRIHQVMLAKSWYMSHMPPLRAAIEDRSVTLPADPDVMDDLRAVRMVAGVAQVPDTARTRGRDGGQRHGDAAVAYALAWYATREISGGPIEYESAGKRRCAFAEGAI